MRKLGRSLAVVPVAALVVLTGCAGPAGTDQSEPAPAEAAPTSTVRVAVASNMQHAMEDLEAAFEQAHPEVDLLLTFGSSGNFYQQIRNGAPFDLFLSADLTLPQQLVDAGLAEQVVPYAVGRMVVWVPDDSPVNLDQGMDALLDPAITKVSIANPEHAPYGQAAVAAMESAGVYDAVRDKLVLGENISQAAEFVMTGNAQIGLIALSLASVPPMAGAGRSFEVPQDMFPPIDQGSVVLTSAADPEAATTAQEFLVGPEGQIILDRFGFYPPGD